MGRPVRHRHAARRDRRPQWQPDQLTLDQALTAGAAVLVANMTATTFTASEGIHILVQAHQSAARAGAQLRVATPGPRVHRVTELTGITGLLDLYPSLEAALDDSLPA